MIGGAQALELPPLDCHPLRQHFDLFLFDLDDTLVPVAGQLSAAQAALFEYMEAEMPNSVLVIKNSMRDLLYE
jgi:FMN phosphatase YigB (HAD superfamily)